MAFCAPGKHVEVAGNPNEAGGGFPSDSWCVAMPGLRRCCGYQFAFACSRLQLQSLLHLCIMLVLTSATSKISEECTDEPAYPPWLHRWQATVLSVGQAGGTRVQVKFRDVCILICFLETLFKMADC